VRGGLCSSFAFSVEQELFGPAESSVGQNIDTRNGGDLNRCE
jgi:hypothetical protein